MSAELKIKIKSLAAEARIIRAEEKKHTGERRAALHNHRVLDVRIEARATLLAYAYLRRRPYKTIERMAYHPPHWHRVIAMVSKYGPHQDKKLIEAALKQWESAPVASTPQAQEKASLST